MRCPRCGFESDIVDEYVCSNCGYIIIREPIERIPIFARREEEWYKPDNMFKRMLNVIINPAKAFWDINHEKKDKGPLMIKLGFALSLGLMGSAANLHVSYPASSTVGGNLSVGFPVFLVYFLFGLIYYSLLIWFYNLMFSIGANFSVRLDDILTIRYNVLRKGNRWIDILSGRRLREEMKLTQEGLTLQSLQKKGEVLTKIKQTGKYNLMTYAYMPLLFVNLIGALIALVGLPTVQPTGTDFNSMNNALNTIGESAVWKIIDILNLFTLAFWVPITMALALREIGNTNTTKLLIGNVIVGIVVAYVLFFLRPTVGWNMNLISKMGGSTDTGTGSGSTTTFLLLSLIKGIISSF